MKSVKSNNDASSRRRNRPPLESRSNRNAGYLYREWKVSGVEGIRRLAISAIKEGERLRSGETGAIFRNRHT